MATARWLFAVASIVLFTASALELVIRVFLAETHRRWLLGDEQLIWQIPLSNALFFGLTALALWWGQRAMPRRITPRFQASALSALCVFAVLLLFHPALHLGAITLLALGIGSVLGALVREPARQERTVFRLGLTGLSLITLLAIGGAGWQYLRERQALGELPTASPRAPDVLLLVLDTVRAMSMGLYGYARPTTPDINDLAAAGVTFTSAFSTSSWTLPSHASLFTGRYPPSLDAGWACPLGTGFPVLAGVLASRGYRTGGFVANVGYASAEHGLARGFTHYEDYGAEWGDILVASSLGRFVSKNHYLRRFIGVWDIPGRKQAPDIISSFLDWRGSGRERPYFAFLNFYDAHEPYLPPAPFDTAFGLSAERDHSHIRSDIHYLNGRMAERSDKVQMTEAQSHEEQKAYDAGIAYLDHEIGRLIDTLRARGELDHTLILLTSDHGEQFGEHGLYSHGNSLYEPTLRVPLVIVWPGHVPAGAIVPIPVSLRDVPATVLDLIGTVSAGARAPDPGLLGKSLAGSWRGDSITPSPVIAAIKPAPNQNPSYPSAKGPLRATLVGGRLYIRGFGGRMEVDPIAGADTSMPVLTGARLAGDRLDSLAAAVHGARCSQ